MSVLWVSLGNVDVHDSHVLGGILLPQPLALSESNKRPGETHLNVKDGNAAV